MSESPADPKRPDWAWPDTPRRIVSDWEYQTAYVQFFQIRVPTALHTRLCEAAQQRRIPMGDLVIEMLQEAVRRREGTSA